MEVLLAKNAQGALAPYDEEAREVVSKLKLWAPIKVTLTRMRNPRFHNKAMALFRFAFENWETPEATYNGFPVQRDFDTFRKNLTILAGFYKSVFNIRGEVRVEAESLSWGAMSEERFELVYNEVINAILKHVLTQYDRPGLDRVVDRLMEFA